MTLAVTLFPLMKGIRLLTVEHVAQKRMAYVVSDFYTEVFTGKHDFTVHGCGRECQLFVRV